MTKKAQSGQLREQQEARRTWQIAVLSAGVALISAAVAVGASFATANMQTRDDTSRQLRELKQSQYAATIKAIGVEAQSLQVVISHLDTGANEAALEEFNRYKGTDALVGESASVSLVADQATVSEMVRVIQSRKSVLDQLNEIAKALDDDGKADPAKVAEAQRRLTAYLGQQAALAGAMRQDLGLPGDLELPSGAT